MKQSKETLSRTERLRTRNTSKAKRIDAWFSDTIALIDDYDTTEADIDLIIKAEQGNIIQTERI